MTPALDVAMPAHLEPSAEVREHIKDSEGLHLTPYRCPGDECTQGYGHTKGITDDSPPITVEIAERWLTEDIAVAVDTVRSWVRRTLTQGQFDALVSFVFNLGPGAPGKRDGFVWLARRNGTRGIHSTLLTKLNARDDAGAAEEFPRWVFGGGKRLGGLETRRAKEKAMFEREK